MKHLALIAAAAAAACAAPAAAQFQEGDYELRLDGFAQSDVNLSSTDITASGTVGYFFSDQLSAGVRQTISYDDLRGKTTYFSTAGYANYHFGNPGAELQPFLGLSLGYNYGNSVNDTFFAGPEVGAKYFFNESWFLFGQAEYQFFFDTASDANRSIDKGSFIFRLGLGVVL